MNPQAQKVKDSCQGLKRRERQGQNPPDTLQGTHGPAGTLTLDFQPPELWNNKSLLFSRGNLWYLVRAALGDGYRGTFGKGP